MELTRYVAPCDRQDVLKLWGDIFGEDEAALEKPQLNGTEVEENLDILYIASEDGVILGTIHATIPRLVPTICGLSGMCTTLESRGKGIGRILFSKIVEEIDGLGIQAAFLGTGNPIAAKLYKSMGFSFLPGSNVMFRSLKGDIVDYTRSTYSAVSHEITIEHGSPNMRIPLIPLVLHQNGQIVLDCNTNLVSSNYMTQYSCMGLYPRYIAIKNNGGDFWGAINEVNVLGAVSSVLPTERGMRADFFCCDTFRCAVPKLIDKCREKYGPVYLEIAASDTVKQIIAKEMGFHSTFQSEITIRNFQIPTIIYEASCF